MHYTLRSTEWDSLRALKKWAHMSSVCQEFRPLNSWADSLNDIWAKQRLPLLYNLLFSPGVGLEDKGHQGSHVFNSKGVFLRNVQLQLWRGSKRSFIVIKELKGLLILVGSRIFPLILWYWRVLCCWRGWFQQLKAEKFVMQALVGVFAE